MHFYQWVEVVSGAVVNNKSKQDIKPMALGKPFVHSTQNQGLGGKYLRPEVKADRDVINHIWASINELHDCAIEGHVTVQNLDDFADCLRQDYGIQVDIVGEGNNFRFSQEGSAKTVTGAILTRHIEKIHERPEGDLPSITGRYICDQFGFEVARRDPLDHQESSAQSRMNHGVRSRQQPSLASVRIGDTEGFDDLLGHPSEDPLEDVSSGDDGSADDGTALQEEAFLSESPDPNVNQSNSPSQLAALDFGEDDADENRVQPTSPATRQPDQPTSVARAESLLSRFTTPEQRPSDAMPPPRSRPSLGSQRGRDPLDSTLSDAASTLSGLASSSTDGVTVMADAGELIAVATAATMLGMETVRQIQQSRDQRQWERLVALGQAIEATEERGRHIAERLGQVEEAFATSHEGQLPFDSERASTSQRPSSPSSSDAAAKVRLAAQADGVNALNDRMSALGQPSPRAEHLRAPKLDSKAPIGQRLDALEAYLANIHQVLDNIEERLTVLEQAVGLTAPGQDAPEPQNGTSAPSRRGQFGDKRVRPKRSKSHQMQA